MTEQLVSFEVAKLAKEKGFDLFTENVWLENAEYGWKNFVGNVLIDWAEEQNYRSSDATYQTPTQSLLQKWLREKHNIHILCQFYCPDDINWIYTDIEIIKIIDNNISKEFLIEEKFNVYEDFLEISLLESLKLI